MICLYATVSLIIGAYLELSDGDPHAKVPQRIWCVVVFAALWPVMLLWALWVMWSLDEGEDLEGPW